MKYSQMFFLLITATIACKGIPAQQLKPGSAHKLLDHGRISEAHQFFSNTLEVSDKPNANIVTITVSDLRFINAFRKDANVHDALNKIEADEEATLNAYWRAIATGESDEKRAELSYAAERVFRDAKMKDFLVTHMRWLNDELREYLLNKKDNEKICISCSQHILQMAALENRKLMDAELTTDPE